MIRRLAATMTGALISVACSVALAVSASATEDDFSPECTAMDIQANNPECVSSVMVMDIDSAGDVEWTFSSVFPRAAFDELVFEVERHTGTTKEYLDTIIQDQPEDDAHYDYTLDDTRVSLTINVSYTQASGDAAGAGVTLLEEEVQIHLEPTMVMGMSRVTVNTPGPVTESNGLIDGNTVQWGSSSLVAGVPLTARAETSTPFMSSRSLVAGVILLAVAALAGLYFFVLRNKKDRGAPHVDLDPVFEEDLDVTHTPDPDTAPGTHTETASAETTTTDKPSPDSDDLEERR